MVQCLCRKEKKCVKNFCQARTRRTLHTHTGNLFLSLLSTLFVVFPMLAVANTVELHWYDNDTELSVSTISQSCAYGGTFDVPTPIPREGYVLTGWRVKQAATYDFATIPTNVNGTNRWAIEWYNNANYCYYNGVNVSCSSDNTYTELQTHEWKVKYSHGDLYGTTMCSTTVGTYGRPGTPSDTNGRHCWCKATGYKVGGTDVIRKPLSVLSWVYGHDYGSVDYCAQGCAGFCAFYTESYAAFRRAVFGVQ